MTPGRIEGRVLVGIVLAGLVWSGVAPVSRLTWLMEVVWVVVGLPVVIWGWRRFPLTRLLCWLLVLHALVLLYGGHYTYAQAPLGNWFRDTFDLTRNDYDRLGHFVQGFVPAILVREILLRRTPLQPGGWLFVLTSSVCLAFSACFEFIEWWSALALGTAADAYLATQGDVWDTQWDMFTCLIGAILAQLALSRAHDPRPRPVWRIVRLRDSSRLIVDGARPSRAAMARMFSPAARPSPISSRSASDNTDHTHHRDHPESCQPVSATHVLPAVADTPRLLQGRTLQPRPPNTRT